MQQAQELPIDILGPLFKRKFLQWELPPTTITPTRPHRPSSPAGLLQESLPPHTDCLICIFCSSILNFCFLSFLFVSTLVTMSCNILKTPIKTGSPPKIFPFLHQDWFNHGRMNSCENARRISISWALKTFCQISINSWKMKYFPPLGFMQASHVFINWFIYCHEVLFN